MRIAESRRSSCRVPAARARPAELLSAGASPARQVGGGLEPGHVAADQSINACATSGPNRTRDRLK